MAIKLTGEELNNKLVILPVKTDKNFKIQMEKGQDSSYLRGHQMYEMKFETLNTQLVALDTNTNSVVLINDLKSFTTDPSDLNSCNLQKLNEFIKISDIINNQA